MIAVEMTAAATPEHLTATKAGQAARIEKMLQELKESLNACFQAQKKEIQRFWTYLWHLEAQKHQFEIYMKSKHANFPESMLQQFNFQRDEETTLAEESEEVETKREAT